MSDLQPMRRVINAHRKRVKELEVSLAAVEAQRDEALARLSLSRHVSDLLRKDVAAAEATISAARAAPDAVEAARIAFRKEADCDFAPNPEYMQAALTAASLNGDRSNVEREIVSLASEYTRGWIAGRDACAERLYACRYYFIAELIWQLPPPANLPAPVDSVSELEAENARLREEMLSWRRTAENAENRFLTAERDALERALRTINNLTFSCAETNVEFDAMKQAQGLSAAAIRALIQQPADGGKENNVNED